MINTKRFCFSDFTLLYPGYMLDDNIGKSDFNDENILSIVELADKYGAKNVVMQCLIHIKSLQPENLLSYAVRHELPVLDVLARHIPTVTPENLAQKCDNDSVHIKALETKCRFQENAMRQASNPCLTTYKKHFIAGYICLTYGVENSAFLIRAYFSVQYCTLCAVLME